MSKNKRATKDNPLPSRVLRLDSDGFIEEFEHMHKGRFPVFRKYFNPMDDVGSKIERAIARSIMSHRSRRLLRVYQITKEYYDAELLDVYFEDESRMMGDIRTCLDVLHANNIVYVDLKRDNMGYSKLDGCWKLFDFDCSGITSIRASNSWRIGFEPKPYFMYKHAVSLLFGSSPGKFVQMKDIDDVLYIDLIKRRLVKKAKGNYSLEYPS